MTTCPECNDTGERDSGGTHPWGEPVYLPCDCKDAEIGKRWREDSSLEKWFPLRAERLAALEAENAALKRDLQYARDGLTKGRTRMREDNERLRAALEKIEAALGLPEDGCNSTQQTLDAIAKLKADATKSERRAITFGDIVQSQVIAMRAAVVAAKLEGLDAGMQWIANTLCGPGHLPDLDEARALGGAQALWDKETAEHEAFRAAHPAP